MCSFPYKYLNRIAAITVALMIALVTISYMSLNVYAEGEEEASDGYQPTEYRLADESINEWEDRVLIAAMDTLENEGRVYYAYGDYVEELVSYFTKDDLNLSKGEANDAIKQIKDPVNAKTGAQSGYLYQIGGKPKNEDSIIEEGEYDGKVYPEFDKNVRFKNESEYKNSDLYKNNKEYIDERTNTVYESKSAMREEMKQLAEADRKYQKTLSKRPKDDSVNEFIAPENAGVVFAAISAAILLITIAVIIIGWRNSTVSLLLGLDDESWNRGNTHRDRHRIRKISAIVLAIVIAIDLVVLYTGITYHSTYGSNNYVEQAMDEGGVCQHSYMQFRDDVHTLLGQHYLPQNTLDLAMTYRNYRFDYVKGTRSAIKNGSDEVTYRGIQESIEPQIELMAYITKNDSDTIKAGVEDIYSESLSTSVGMFINKLRKSISVYYIAGFIMSMISLIMAAIMIVIERRSIYRGVGNLATGALAGTAVWGALTAVISLKVDASQIGFEDDAVYVTNTYAVNGLTTIMMTLLGISAVASLMIFVTSKIMQRKAL